MMLLMGVLFGPGEGLNIFPSLFVIDDLVFLVP